MAATIKLAVLQLSRLSLNHGQSCFRTLTTQSGPLAFRATNALGAEPMRKRKKMDVNIIIQRETKKKRRLEKAIRKLENKGRQLKPIEEIEGDRAANKTKELRRREPVHLTFEESERRALLMKAWSRYKFKQNAAQQHLLSRALRSQQRALNALQEESEELYEAAIQCDPGLIPFTAHGPVHTPPIDNFDPPDGEYIDTTKKFDK